MKVAIVGYGVVGQATQRTLKDSIDVILCIYYFILL